MKGRARGLAGTRSRYRPDGTRRRTAGELRARGARNQWPPSTSQNKRGADNRPRASKRGTALSPCNLVLKPTSANTEVRARTSIETTAGEIGTADPGMARLAGKRNGSGPGNTEDATVAGTGSPPTRAAAAAGPTTLDGRTPPEIGSRLKDTEALPTLQRGGARLLRAAAHDSPLDRSTPLGRQRQPG